MGTKRNFKRLVVVSDLHCGHRIGLTPPDWNSCKEGDERDLKYHNNRTAMWNFYVRQMEALKPIDILICNGDAIDGKGERSGGVDILEPNRLNQAKMATRALAFAEAKEVYFTYGTPYHTGIGEEFEELVAGNSKGYMLEDSFVRIKGPKESKDDEGVLFDFKHHLGSSQLPHTRFTALGRERVWGQIWTQEAGDPLADVIVRSHVHYHVFAGGVGWLGITTPALQGRGSTFGLRMCSGKVDIGFVHFDVYDGDKQYEWYPHILRATILRKEVVDL